MPEPTPALSGRPWYGHAPTYRAAEMQQLARWIAAGASGSVIGLRGVGRSNLLGFLCHRPEVLQGYLPDPTLTVLLVPVDLNNLPDPTLATFYRVLLRAFYEVRTQLPADLQIHTTQLFFDNRAATDPFLPQSALRELFFHLQAQGYRLILVLDRFDSFCRMITPELGDTLSGLRDSFRDMLSYIVGVRQSLVYLETLELASDLVRALTTYTCELGPLVESDAIEMIHRETAFAGQAITVSEGATMLTLSGGYPSLLKAICQWWALASNHPPVTQWSALLAELPTITRRLQEIWTGLTQEEQQVLAELVLRPAQKSSGTAWQRQRQQEVLNTLARRGLCRQEEARWVLFGTLFTDFVQRVGGLSRGAIWCDEASRTFYQGATPLVSLTPKERSVLDLLFQQPARRHTYTDVIVSAWDEEERYHGVSNDALFQVIRGLRQKIEPDPTEPVYVVNWRGKPEGGYSFYAEGRPT